MRLSSLADYAVVMMGAAARHCGSASLVDAEGRKRARTSATELAAETGIPLPTAQKLVSLLTRAGLLKSVRGAGGGIKLARPSAAISLADIIEAIEGPIAMTNCTTHTTCSCTIAPDCSVKPHWNAVNSAIRGALGDVSLASISAGARI
ncbi:Rrf2 family transcriptional regulator [Sphingobium sp. DEHP117]|uniref:RrF2 family transcriptional regulator n=1 Tax=Sphingobium sp. DEHP117 TaxID=2993436 RepID=UPI0027D73CC8|nr:Rrf2 family transcriptional regulator [Sphingobium sp. DEHP117]MDQ4421369.1 Rrf2 family transcriptional regulator [Sphingobium sp. DEHP117]